MEYLEGSGQAPLVPEILESEDEEKYLPRLDQEYYDQLGSETFYDEEEDIEEPSYPTQEEYDQLGTEFHKQNSGQVI